MMFLLNRIGEHSTGYGLKRTIRLGWVQFKMRVIPELVDALRIQNFEKAATNYTKGFIFTRPWALSRRTEAKWMQRNALTHARG
jgi:hypothetical protein